MPSTPPLNLLFQDLLSAIESVQAHASNHRYAVTKLQFKKK